MDGWNPTVGAKAELRLGAPRATKYVRWVPCLIDSHVPDAPGGFVWRVSYVDPFSLDTIHTEARADILREAQP